METDRYVVTGINKLTRIREEISGAMPLEMAQERLDRELANRRYHRYLTHTRLRVEKQLPVQLTLNFQNYE